MNLFHKAALATALSAVVGVASAATITQVTQTGTVYSTAGLTGYSTNGNEMDGMSVTATWINSSGTIFTNTQAWADLPGSPSNDGGVRFVNNSGNNDFTLEVSGDTFDSNNWDLEFYISGASSRLLSLDFDGTTGRTVFDICDGNAYCQSNPYGTPGSATGRDFAGFGDFSGSITATYYNAVAIGNDAPVGDIYAGFRLEFGDGTYAKGLGENSSVSFSCGFSCNPQYNFTLDTDNATTEIVQQPPQGVPAPGTAAVLGIGLLGLIASRRKQRKA